MIPNASAIHHDHQWSPLAGAYLMCYEIPTKDAEDNHGYPTVDPLKLDRPQLADADRQGITTVIRPWTH